MIQATSKQEASTLAFLEGLSQRARTVPSRSQVLAKQSRHLQAAYDAAQYTETNRNYWRNADLLSADAANSPEVRKTLRSRARYECLEANSFARGIVNTLANDTIGRGPMLQLMLGDDEANCAIEQAWKLWAKHAKLAHKLRTARKAKFVDGETFIRLVTNRRLRGPVQLDIEVIESDRVCNTIGIEDPDREVDGIRFDADGNPESYKILRAHPGSDSLHALEFETVPANQMIHLFRHDRPGQRRGVPECTTALPLFILFRDYTLAVVQNARSVAKHTVLLKTAASVVDEDGNKTFNSAIDPFESVDIDYDMITSMPHGWEPFQLRADQPTTTYEMFRRAIWGEIARTADMPYNVAAGDSSRHNYASGRLDYQPYDFAVDVERGDWEADCLDVIFEAWYDEYVLSGQAPDGIGPHEELPHDWFWHGREHADPAKEAQGQATRLRSGVTNRRREMKKEGIDIDAHDREAAEDYGMTVQEYRRMIAASAFNAQPLVQQLEEDDDEEPVETEPALAA